MPSRTCLRRLRVMKEPVSGIDRACLCRCRQCTGKAVVRTPPARDGQRAYRILSGFVRPATRRSIAAGIRANGRLHAAAVIVPRMSPRRPTPAGCGPALGNRSAIASASAPSGEPTLRCRHALRACALPGAAGGINGTRTVRGAGGLPPPRFRASAGVPASAVRPDRRNGCSAPMPRSPRPTG